MVERWLMYWEAWAATQGFPELTCAGIAVLAVLAVAGLVLFVKDGGK